MFEELEFEFSYKDTSGKSNTAYKLPKREAMILASGYSIKLRALIIDKTSDYASIKKMEFEYDEKFTWQMMKRISAELCLDIKKVFDQNYGTVNSYHKDVWLKAYDRKVLK